MNSLIFIVDLNENNKTNIQTTLSSIILIGNYKYKIIVLNSVADESIQNTLSKFSKYITCINVGIPDSIFSNKMKCCLSVDTEYVVFINSSIKLNKPVIEKNNDFDLQVCIDENVNPYYLPRPINYFTNFINDPEINLFNTKYSECNALFRSWNCLCIKTSVLKTIINKYNLCNYTKLFYNDLDIFYYYLFKSKLKINVVTNKFFKRYADYDFDKYDKNDTLYEYKKNNTINTLNLFINNNNLNEYELFIFKNIIHSLEYPNDLYSRLFNTTNIDIMYKLKEYTYNTFINDINTKYSKTNKLLSIVIPVYDNEEYLERCLDSIFIHNKFIKELIDKEICEVIVLNDYDNKMEKFNNICKKYNVTGLVNTRFRNIFSTRCKLFRLSKGEYVSTVDTDDIYNNNVFDVILYQLLGYKYHLNHILDIIKCGWNYSNVDNSQNLYCYTTEKIIQTITSFNTNISFKEIYSKYSLIQSCCFMWGDVVKRESVYNFLDKLSDINVENWFIGSADDQITGVFGYMRFNNYLTIPKFHIIEHYGHGCRYSNLKYNDNIHKIEKDIYFIRTGIEPVLKFIEYIKNPKTMIKLNLTKIDITVIIGVILYGFIYYKLQLIKEYYDKTDSETIKNKTKIIIDYIIKNVEKYL